MTKRDFIEVLKGKDYDFLRADSRLGDNIIILGLGGSHAYGTDTESSDIDIRGCALNSRQDILCGEDFEQVVDSHTDTTIYSFSKLVQLLTNCNPNTIELLGLYPDHYLYLSDIGKEFINNRKLFLSKKAINSFGGYATAQFRRLDNKSGRMGGQSIQEQHILNSIKRDAENFNESYFYFPEDSINLYIDKAVNEELDTEIFMDINLRHYPLRDYRDMWSRMNSIVKNYGQLGKRNKAAISHNKLGKHMMHCIRLYIMCIDILEKCEIITYRIEEHDLLMDIRNGKYIDDTMQPTQEFFELVKSYEARLEYAKTHTELPDKPDYKKIKEFVMSVNERVICSK